MSSRLARVALSRSASKEDYEQQLPKLQLKLLDWQFQIRKKGVPVVICFEGWDAAGKGGAIKRLVEKLDPRGYVVVPVGPPEGPEATHHYLWRFWTRMPEKGQIVIFDRSWYGRVLVERIEGFCSKDAWQRAYGEINEFEKILVDGGTQMFKFFLHIDKKEQLKRFKDREKDPYKQWKITGDDWRNRKKWDEYAACYEDMFAKTSTRTAPWTIVPSNCKRFSRMAVVRTVLDSRK